MEKISDNLTMYWLHWAVDKPFQVGYRALKKQGNPDVKHLLDIGYLKLVTGGPRKGTVKITQAGWKWFICRCGKVFYSDCPRAIFLMFKRKKIKREAVEV